jgi:hypothetical protein
MFQGDEPTQSQEVLFSALRLGQQACVSAAGAWATIRGQLCARLSRSREIRRRAAENNI